MSRLVSLMLAIAALGLPVPSAGLRLGAVQYQGIDGPPSRETLMMNAQKFVQVALNASLNQGVDLVVFPEFALLGPSGGDKLPLNCLLAKTFGANSCEQLPATGSAVNCNAASFTSSSSPLETIACATAKFGVTISYNTCESPLNSTLLYNTQVVVRQGVVIAQYRKYHPFFSTCFSKPALSLVTFLVRGATVGLFTCYDILFPSPKLDLVRTGVKLFAYSSAVPVVGRLSVRAFSALHAVTVVSANNAAGDGGVVVNGTLAAQCPQQGDCVAVHDV